MTDEKYKILIADDSELSYRIIVEILNIVGSNVDIHYAENGKLACDMALELLPDLILMDVIMPERNGIEAVRYLREQETTRDIPVIVLSATESLNSAYDAGANDFISKPFQKHELLIKVRSGIHLVQNLRKIQEQKERLEGQNHELIAQRDKIDQQRKDILDDIRYSKRIQAAILPNGELMQRVLPSHFILNLPRNIVSGDFYWVGEQDGFRTIAVADCTGHGVSGAFMTMAGTAFLNEIQSRQAIQAPNEVLFELRKLVMKLLQQKGEEGEAADGMDISMVRIHPGNRKMEFAGANNPLYRLRNGELEIFKGDRMPIGIHLNFNTPFVCHEIDLLPGDILYMFTDGYADQFGGPRNKKFRYKQFQDLLEEIYPLPMPEQKERLQSTMLAWMGANDQVDDILILGFQIL